MLLLFVLSLQVELSVLRRQITMPNKVLGMYVLLADDTVNGFHTDDDWEPLLYPYQQVGCNMLFLKSINPTSMEVPLSFKKLVASRGTGNEGAVPADTLIIFMIGGYGYSQPPWDPWYWLTSKDKAEAMAEKVAQWREEYGIDGVDLDIERGAGSHQEAGTNMVHFVKKLKSLQPDLLITQPTYGTPQITAEIDVINASWNADGSCNDLADSVGIMFYNGTGALTYVDNYAHGSQHGEGYPIQVDVPKAQIMVGSRGTASEDTINTLAEESVKQDLLGIMVWYCSVRNGLVYGHGTDCNESQESISAYVAAMDYFKDHTQSIKTKSTKEQDSD